MVTRLDSRAKIPGSNPLPTLRVLIVGASYNSLTCDGQCFVQGEKLFGGRQISSERQLPQMLMRFKLIFHFYFLKRRLYESSHDFFYIFRLYLLVFTSVTRSPQKMLGISCYVWRTMT